MDSDGWRATTFKDLIDSGVLEVGDGYRAKNDELGGGGPIFLRAGHVTDTHIDFNGVEHFRHDRSSAVKHKMSRPGDTIVTTKGNSTGRTSYVTDDMPPFVYSPHLSYWRSLDPSTLVPDFLRYWSRGQEFDCQLAGMKASTDMAPYLSLTDQRRLRITLPPACEQASIGKILGALDNKIDLNRRMNRTLEGIARAIFRSWFVDFDPVHAKSAGQTPPGLAPHIADLFPDAFESSELGEIPRGWRVARIDEVADVVGGSTPSTKEPAFWEDGVHCWATPKDLSGLSVPVLLETERRITDAGLGRIGTGLLPVDTVLLSSRAPIGYLAITQVPVAVNQGFIAMKPRLQVPATFLLRWAEAAHDAIVSRANGSTFLEISKTNFRPIQLVMPDERILKEFGRLTSTLFQRVVMNEKQSRILSSLRDALLPKLISGELRIPDAEGVLAGAV